MPFHIKGAILFFILLITLLVSCKDRHPHVGEKQIVAKPEDINLKAEEVIQGTLKDILQNNRDISDSIKLKNASIVQSLYDSNDFQPLWSAKGSFNPWSDSLVTLIDSCRNYGLFPVDYYQARIKALKNELTVDTSRENKLDASKWAYSDLLLTAAFVQLVRDISKGRLMADSVLTKDSTWTPSFFSNAFSDFKKLGVDSFASRLEPQNTVYKNLEQGLRQFLGRAHLKSFTFIRTEDSLQVPALVYKRLLEEDTLARQAPDDPDSVAIASVIKKYQKKKKIKVDGRITPPLIDRLNNTDLEKFIRIAITLDKLKMLPPLPQQYIWVNIPSFYLQVRDSDSVVLSSRIVVGKPETRTPVLTSAITDMITYPKWHIPESIIKKDILPGLKKDPGYTLRKGFTLVDDAGNEIDPYSVNWLKFKEGIPYNVVQGSGDENALGVMKFNFPNKYSVYLHDTNQRYLFSKSNRALSHGCVRVQAWQDLTNFILRNDSAFSEKAIPLDSVNTWLALKEKHVIPVRKKIPLFIRYFTCEGKDGKVLFYEDVYGEDRRIREQIFSDK